MNTQKIALNDWMGEARVIASQCWCDDETKHIEMDVVLAEAIARRIAAWMQTGAQHATNEDYWRNRALKAEAAIQTAQAGELPIYAYDVRDHKGSEMVYAEWFRKYGNPFHDDKLYDPLVRLSDAQAALQAIASAKQQEPDTITIPRTLWDAYRLVACYAEVLYGVCTDADKRGDLGDVDGSHLDNLTNALNKLTDEFKGFRDSQPSQPVPPPSQDSREAFEEAASNTRYSFDMPEGFNYYPDSRAQAFSEGYQAALNWARSQQVPLSQDVMDHCWKMYKQGQISADHTAKEVFEQMLQSFANWLAPPQEQANEQTYLQLSQEVIKALKRLSFAVQTLTVEVDEETKAALGQAEKALSIAAVSRAIDAAEEQAKDKELLSVLKEVREALQFANDSPGGGINDTIWMMHRPENLFDFIDSAIAKQAQQKGGSE